MKYYTVYLVTNLVNGKFYIGKHVTKDPLDDYLGSGRLLLRAIAKYGRQSFTKKVLFIGSDEHKMNLAEKIFVVIDSEVSYNLKRGGEGGFDFINERRLNHKFSLKDASKGGKNSGKSAKHLFAVTKANQDPKKIEHVKKFFNFKGRKHSDSTLLKLKEIHGKNDHQKGKKNSQYGTMWITDGIHNLKIKNDGLIPFGWKKGRVI